MWNNGTVGRKRKVMNNEDVEHIKINKNRRSVKNKGIVRNIGTGRKNGTGNNIGKF